MKKLLLLLALSLVLSTSFAQDYKKIDSLKQILKTLPELNGTDADTTRMNICIKIGEMFVKANIDSAKHWYVSVADTVFDAKKIKNYPRRAKQNANALNNIGVVARKQGNYPAAIEYYTRSLEIFEEFGDKSGISKCLFGLGNVANNQGNYPTAIEYYTRTLKISEELGDKSGISKCLIGLGNVANNQGNYPTAIEYYTRSLKISEELGDKSGMSACLNNIGALASMQGNYTAAIEYITRSLKISEELSNKSGISYCLNNLGALASKQKQYIAAIEYYTRSLKISEELSNKSGISACFYNLGHVAMEQGNYPAAIDYYTRSLEIFEEFGDKLGISDNLNNLGVVARYQGNYPVAIDYYTRSLKISEGIEDKSRISRCFTGLGTLAMEQGNYPAAIDYYARSLKIYEDLGDKSGISLCLNSLGALASKQGQYIAAIEYYNRSMKISEELSNKSGISDCLINLGIEAKEQCNYIAAIDYYTHSLKIKEEYGYKSGISACLSNLGEIAMYQGNYPAAIDYYARSLKIDEDYGVKANLAEVYPALAKVYARSGQNQKATVLLQKALDICLWQLKDNFSIMSEQDKELYLVKTKTIFNDIHAFKINYSTDNDSLQGICYINELILKGLLLKSTAGIINVVNNSADTALKNVYWILKQYRNQISDLHGTEKEKRDSIIADLEQKANEQERKLVKMSAEFTSIQNLFNYKWEDIQKNLKPNEAAIEFVQIKHTLFRPDTCKKDSINYAALILKNGMQHPQMIPLCNEGVLQKMVGKLGWSNTSMVDVIYKKGSVKGKKLYELIWQPLENYLTDIKTIYMAPVGDLNLIAFAAIPINEQQLLGEKYQINMVSSTRALIDRITQPTFLASKENKAVVFGGIQYAQDSLLIKQLADYYKTDKNKISSNIRDIQSDYNQPNYWQYLEGTKQEANQIKQLLN